ncbi:MAG TPA: DUF2188 domain-containing protein [Candidatus Dojkabacteria bacterium]|jgi:hypothetical protein
MQNTIYLNPNDNNSWTVKVLGDDFSANNFKQKRDALRYARRVAKLDKLQMIVRRRDGIFQFRNY